MLMCDPVSNLNFVSDVLIILAWLGVSVFLTTYLIRFPWFSTEAGRSLVVFASGVWGLLMINGLAVWFGPDYFFRTGLRFIVYAYLFFAVWWFVRVLVGNLFKDRKSKSKTGVN